MKTLKIKVLQKQQIIFSSINASFIRNVQATLNNKSVDYTGGTTENITLNEILYTTGTSGQPGFLEVKAGETKTLAGSGSFVVHITHYPTSTAINTTTNVTVDTSSFGINFVYNSIPVTSNFEVETTNRTPYTLTTNDFLSHITDYDNDAIIEIQLIGDVSGFTLNGTAIISGQWITIADISNNLLVYTPLNQDTYYEKNIDYKAKDSNGNISE